MSNINSSASIIGTAGDPSNFPIRITARDGSLLSWVDENGFLGGNFKVGTGGSETPGGSNQQIQYNNNGVFGGIAVSSYNPDPTGPSINIADPNLVFEVLSGPAEQNGVIVTNAGVSVQAGESGSFLQFNADSDIDIQSNNGNLNLSTSGGSIEIFSTGEVLIGNSPTNPLAFYGSSAHSQQTITGITTTDLASLQAVVRGILTALANVGLIVDGTT